MSDELDLLRETLDAALRAAHRDGVEQLENGAIAEVAWRQALELGWDLIGLPIDLDGFGDSVAPLVALARLCGAYPVAMPVIETALARWALAHAGGEQPASHEVLTIAPGALDGLTAVTGDRFSGEVTRVPWLRHASRLILTGQSSTLAVIAIDQPGVDIHCDVNLAGEPRDRATLTDAAATLIVGEAAARTAVLLPLRAALFVAAQMFGAMQQTLAATREHTAARTQFGRSLDSFQLIGAHIAQIASHLAAVEGLLDEASLAHDLGEPRGTTAALRVVASRAATMVARSAHQCHGAIGVTREYRLHHYSRRLWAWREEQGGERHWSRVLGAAALDDPREAIWGLTQPTLEPSGTAPDA
jgi:alkylation response protein AidB-like acyl-CoA dehydrogenase